MAANISATLAAGGALGAKPNAASAARLQFFIIINKSQLLVKKKLALSCALCHKRRLRPLFKTLCFLGYNALQLNELIARNLGRS